MCVCVCVCVCAAWDGGAGEQDGETGGGLEETGVGLSQYPSQTPCESILAALIHTYSCYDAQAKFSPQIHMYF